MTTHKAIRIIISGGGTGGHIFPAISIADKIRELSPESEILFVGAEGKMEMEKVPTAGYKIIGLPVVGLQRQLNLKNLINDLKAPFKLISSLIKAKRLIKEFGPDIAVGVGGYASAPLLWAAQSAGVPTLIQEQNGFAGLTNKILGKKADCICVAYEGMDRFFPSDKIIMTGNPIRKEIMSVTPEMKAEGLKYYNMSPDKKTILIVGGSLGSGTLNRAMKKWIDNGCQGGENIQVLWQCGKYYKPSIDEYMDEARKVGKGGGNLNNITYSDFIGRMDLAYAAADIVISRSGASTVSELCVARKAAIFVPSPNVAEDHQTHNALALVRKNAAMIVKDSEADEELMSKAINLANNSTLISEMEKNISELALPDAAKTIAEEIFKIVARGGTPQVSSIRNLSE